MGVSTPSHPEPEPFSPSLGWYYLGARFLGGKSIVKVSGQGEMDSKADGWLSPEVVSNGSQVGVRGGPLVQVPGSTLIP